MSAYDKVPKHSLQNKFEISMRKKYQKMEVSKFLYFALVNFNLMLFTLWSSILLYDQFKCHISQQWNLVRLNDVTVISMLSTKIGEWPMFLFAPVESYVWNKLHVLFLDFLSMRANTKYSDRIVNQMTVVT